MNSFSKVLIFIFISFLSFSSFTINPPSEIGNAVIIEDARHGKSTACDLKYDKHQNYATHKTHACGTKVKVTVLATNKSIIVTIVDRGPNVKGQIIALSSNAASQIGMTKETRVKVEVLDGKKNSEKTAKKSSKTTVKKESDLNVIQEAAEMKKGGLYKIQVLMLEPKGWGVQVAAYSTYESVIQQLAALQNNWFKGGLVHFDETDGKSSYKIIMGPFFTREEADSYCSSIKEKYKIKDAFVLDLNLLKDSGR